MSTDPTPSGRRVLVRELGEDPMDALEHHMELAPMDPPAKDALGPRDVVVSIKSASVNWVDLIMASGQYQHVPTPPYVPGLEYAGVVSWVGPEVSSLSIGDGVLSDGLLVGPRSIGGYQRWGGYASWAVAPAEALHRIPGGLTFDQACNLLGSYETAYHCLVTRGRVQRGETVLVHGASGSTGLAAVHVAKILGATVIATGRSEEKLAKVKAEGADHVVVIRRTEAGIEPFRDQVKALTGGRGVDVVYDGVGGPVSVESLRAVRFGARLLVVGWAATPNVAAGKGQRGAPNANQLPTNLVMMKGLDVLGCPTVISTLNDPSLRPPRLGTVLGWARDGLVRPHVSHTFPLERFADALRAKWSGEVVGGAALHP
jgi:NADPH2:quinone reductase